MRRRNANEIQQRLLDCLGQAIQFRRRRLGMSQEELAQKAGVDRAFISKVEGGKRNPSFGLVSSLAHGLKMTYARLVHNCEQCVCRQEVDEQD